MYVKPIIKPSLVTKYIYNYVIIFNVYIDDTCQPDTATCATEVRIFVCVIVTHLPVVFTSLASTFTILLKCVHMYVQCSSHASLMSS